MHQNNASRNILISLVFCVQSCHTHGEMLLILHPDTFLIPRLCSQSWLWWISQYKAFVTNQYAISNTRSLQFTHSTQNPLAFERMWDDVLSWNCGRSTRGGRPGFKCTDAASILFLVDNPNRHHRCTFLSDFVDSSPSLNPMPNPWRDV